MRRKSYASDYFPERLRRGHSSRWGECAVCCGKHLEHAGAGVGVRNGDTVRYGTADAYRAQNHGWGYDVRKSITPAQIALAWVLHQTEWIVPILDTRKLARLWENIGAADVSLSSQELANIRPALDNIEIQGDRYIPGSDAAKWVGI